MIRTEAKPFLSAQIGHENLLFKPVLFDFWNGNFTSYDMGPILYFDVGSYFWCLLRSAVFDVCLVLDDLPF